MGWSRIDDFLHANTPGGFQDPQSAQYVAVGVPDWVLGRLVHAGLGRHVKHQIGLFPLDDLSHGWLGDVSVMEDRLGVEVLDLARAQVIHHDDLIVQLKQPLHHV